MTAFAQAIKPASEGGSGALPAVTFLRLSNNNFGDAGMTAFASAVGSGTLASITEISMEGNQATDEGKKAMRDLAEARGSIRSMYLSM